MSYEQWKRTQFENRRQAQTPRIFEQQRQFSPEQTERLKEVARTTAMQRNEPVELHLQLRAGSEEERVAAAKALRNLRVSQAGPDRRTVEDSAHRKPVRAEELER